MEKILNNEIDEKNIKELVDYSPIVKRIRFVPVKTRFNTYYNLTIDIDGVTGLTTRGDVELVRYMQTCEKLGKKAVKFNKLVKETSDGKEYTCVKFVLSDDKVFRYFVNRADVSTIEIVYEDYMQKSKNKEIK